jgi:hypothetical protein
MINEELSIKINDILNAQSEINLKINKLQELVKTAEEVKVEPIKLAPTVASVIKDYKALSSDERVAVFQSLFSLGNLGEAIDNKLLLIALTGSITLSLRKKDPKAGPIDAINKLVDLKALNTAGMTDEQAINFKETLALYVGEFLGGVTIPNYFGITAASDVKAKVNEILRGYIPF